MTNPTPSSTPGEVNPPARSRQRITPRALLTARSLASPKLHPDGRHVAFVVTEADFDESRYVSHLWLTEWLLPDTEAAEDGGEPDQDAAPSPTPDTHTPEPGSPGNEDPTRQITFSQEGESHPQWSPDGRYLAFLSARPDPSEPLPDEEDDEDEPREQIWVLPLDGGEARKITDAKEGVLDYAWTPDSSALVYLAPEPRPRPIESVRKEERNRRKVDPIVEQEDRLRRQFWRVDVEERKPKRVFTGDYGISEFALAPDGERLCYITNYTGEWNDYHLEDLWVLHLASGATFKLLERAGGKNRPRWAPDGKQVAFLTWLDPQLSYSRESLFMVDVPPEVPAPESLGERTPRLLTDASFDYDIFPFEWSRHDGRIYALAAVHTGSKLLCIDADGTRFLETEAIVEHSDLDIDPAGEALVFVQESATALPEIYLRDLRAEPGSTHRLTKLNADFTANYRLPRQEVVQWRSPDGTPIEGILTYPLDYQEGQRCPLIVQIHGGPKGQSTHTLRSYSLPPVWSAEGYAVLRPNFRGSMGYGNAFAIANRRDLGGGDFADIMAGVDWCIAQGIADPDRLGVMGGSYGGYMTNWAIGHTDRFKAAISMFGIFYLQTDYSNSDLSRWDNDYLGAYYWEDPEIYRRLSPGSYIENIKTPTLILHGDDDSNTFISNSKELYQALRHRGITTQFVHYPREGHGLREPNHKLDEIRRCLAWMDRYVRDRGQIPSLYRLGDKVPHSNGNLELCVTSAEIASFLGQPEPSETPEASTETPNALLEVVFTIHNRDTRQPITPLTLALSDIRLEPQARPADTAPTTPSSPLPESWPLTPVGVPLDLPGGKVLVEGENLRTTQHPNANTGDLAFAFGVVFRVPKSGDCRLRIADFPPVALHWSPDEDNTEETKGD